MLTGITELLSRGVEEIIDKTHLQNALKSNKKLRVKLGIDPTSPNIHIGRAVILWKLRAFQELGHKVIFIVGDFTGLIGDTSDKEAERPMLTEAQVRANMQTYFQQAFKILDKQKTETYYNSEWLKRLGFKEIGQMADQFGLHEFESRENVALRLKAGKRVSLRELLYPLMQGYDSVKVRADVELGGTDQKFNLLAGRKIQKFFGQEPQDILTMTLMPGTDGRKMSSSWGNVINITDKAEDMFGKVMSIADHLIKPYFLLATRLPMGEIGKILKEFNPRDQKMVLAEEITKLYHGQIAANQAKEKFILQFVKKEIPQDAPKKCITAGSYKLSELLLALGFVASKSEAKRLIQQNGVKLDNQVLNTDTLIEITKKPRLIQVGKRKILRLEAS